MKKFQEYLNERYMVDDMDDILHVVRDYLEDMADHTEKTEPYATKEIERLRNAAFEVSNIRFYDDEPEPEPEPQMKTFTVIYTETMRGEFEVEATDPTSAVNEFWRLVGDGKIDLLDTEMVDSDATVEE